MIPTGTPANHARPAGTVGPGGRHRCDWPAMASSARPVPTSIAALLERPPPRGRVLLINESIPTSGIPARASGGHAPAVIGPFRLAALNLLRDRKFRRLSRKSRDAKAHQSIVLESAGDPHFRLDGHREDEAVVVVGVLADQVHAPGARMMRTGPVPTMPLPKVLRNCSRSSPLAVCMAGNVEPDRCDGQYGNFGPGVVSSGEIMRPALFFVPIR